MKNNGHHIVIYGIFLTVKENSFEPGTEEEYFAFMDLTEKKHLLETLTKEDFGFATQLLNTSSSKEISVPSSDIENVDFRIRQYENFYIAFRDTKEKNPKSYQEYYCFLK